MAHERTPARAGSDGETWIVGDIHGWDGVFAQLLETIDFDPRVDRLWLAGDLVRRGPDSLGVLRRAKGLADAMGERFVTVLGNHDLHLLAADLGLRSAGDAQPVLDAPDRRELLDWLRSRPLLHVDRSIDPTRPTVLVHAGLWPSWTLDEAETAAERLRQGLRSDAEARTLLEDFGRVAPGSLRSGSLAHALYGVSVLRALASKQRAIQYSGPLAKMPDGAKPWFRYRRPRSDQDASPLAIYFGHWAALGFHHREGDPRRPTITCLDSGCAWGGRLSALRLRDGAVRSVDNPASPRHG